MNLGELNYSVAKGGNSDLRGYAIYDSLDGFTNALYLTQLADDALSAKPQRRTVGGCSARD